MAPGLKRETHDLQENACGVIYFNKAHRTLPAQLSRRWAQKIAKP
jgi:hypothetical protein